MLMHTPKLTAAGISQLSEYSAASDCLLPAMTRPAPCLPSHALCSAADFKSVQEMTDWLTKDDPKMTPALTQLRSLADSAIRVAIALPAQSYSGAASKVAKERASMP
jgi:hypothetical protein